MYSPDDKEAPHELAASMRRPEGNGGSRLLPERERMRFYLVNCAGIREHYGFEMVPDPAIEGKKRLVLKDRAKFERHDHETKALLRELYQDLK